MTTSVESHLPTPSCRCTSSRCRSSIASQSASTWLALSPSLGEDRRGTFGTSQDKVRALQRLDERLDSHRQTEQASGDQVNLKPGRERRQQSMVGNPQGGREGGGRASQLTADIPGSEPESRPPQQSPDRSKGKVMKSRHVEEKSREEEAAAEKNPPEICPRDICPRSPSSC